MYFIATNKDLPTHPTTIKPYFSAQLPTSRLFAFHLGLSFLSLGNLWKRSLFIEG